MAIIEDLHVSYRTYHDPKRGIRQLATRSKSPRRHTTVHAVRGVDLTLHEGEYFGLVGKNGSGKSTLLSAMTGLLPIDSGSVRVRSRPRLLGIGGAAMRPGVSGRQNLLIGGLAVGIPKRQMDEQLDELVAFVGIGDAIDRPISSYSSGMRARLQFTVATLTAPDILLVDEALAVGDASFKERAQDRIGQILGSAGTVVMVSHNVEDLAHRCDRVGWLVEGMIKEIGDPETVVEAYLADSAGS